MTLVRSFACRVCTTKTTPVGWIIRTIAVTGFPLTSSLMESTVKQVSRRVKGSEKFWSSSGGEAMLRLRGEYLSDDEPMRDYWDHRSRQASGTRAHRSAGEPMRAESRCLSPASTRLPRVTCYTRSFCRMSFCPHSLAGLGRKLKTRGQNSCSRGLPFLSALRASPRQLRPNPVLTDRAIT